MNTGKADVTRALETLKKLRKKCWEQAKGLCMTEQFPNIFCDLLRDLLMFWEPRFAGGRQRAQAAGSVLWKCGQVGGTFCCNFHLLRKGGNKISYLISTISKWMYQHCTICESSLLAKVSFFLSLSSFIVSFPLVSFNIISWAIISKGDLTFSLVSFGPPLIFFII